MSHYTEQDTEKARQREQGAVGTATRPLSNTPPHSPSVRAHANNPAAVALIGVGLLVLFSNLLGNGGRGGMDLLAPNQSGELTGSIFFLTLSSCFLFFAFWRRIYGLLVPGCILAGFAVGLPFVDLTNGASFFWGLAAGFIAIMLIGRKMFNYHSNWPVFPAVPLFAIGTIAIATQIPALFTGVVIWLPLLLIGLGLYLGRRRTI